MSGFDYLLNLVIVLTNFKNIITARMTADVATKAFMSKEDRHNFKQQITMSTADGDIRGNDALKLPSNLPWLNR